MEAYLNEGIVLGEINENSLPFLSLIYSEAAVLDKDRTELYERCLLARI